MWSVMCRWSCVIDVKLIYQKTFLLNENILGEHEGPTPTRPSTTEGGDAIAKTKQNLRPVDRPRFRLNSFWVYDLG